MTTNPRTAARTWPRRLLVTTGTFTLTLATLAGIVLAGVVVTSRSTNRPVPTCPLDASPASLRYAEPGQTPGRRLVVAFVVGTHGTVASDLLAPYDIIASSPAFTTYVVADTATPAPLEGGPAVVPTYTFADVDADPALSPDLVVVPALSHPTGAKEAPLRSWVTSQHNDGPRSSGCAAAR
jgi:hypothetical protein